MNKYKFFSLIGFVFFLSTNCFAFSSELKGVIQNGLNGQRIEGATIYIKGSNISSVSDADGRFVLKFPSLSIYGEVDGKSTSQYLKNTPQATEMILQVDKENFYQLEYLVNDRINNLILGILPEAKTFKKEEYCGNNLSNTILLEENVKWEEIIDGVRLYHENRLHSLKLLRERYWKRNSTSDEAYEISVEPNRSKLRTILGALDEREPVSMTKKEKVSETNLSNLCSG